MKNVQLQIFLGIILVLATSGLIIFYGVTEPRRMAANAAEAQAREIEVGAALFEAQCSRCHGTQGLGIPGLCPPLNDRYFFDQRLKDVGWSGTQEDYIIATASSGRLVSTRPQTYPGQGTPAMPSFSDQYGGPLRPDQIQSIAAFIMNWKDTAQVVEAPAQLAGPAVGTDITKNLPEGNAANGEKLTASLACTACHILAPTGPAWMAKDGQPGIGSRAAERIKDPGYTGKATSPEQYLFESIVNPNGFVVSGFPPNVMPPSYANQLTDQDMADIIAYLQTLK
jgi:mono/diheme cytochrome c family protein